MTSVRELLLAASARSQEATAAIGAALEALPAEPAPEPEEPPVEEPPVEEPPPPPPPGPEPDIQVGDGGGDAIAAIQAQIASGDTDIVLGIGTHVLDPLPLIGALHGLNACLDVGGTTGLTIRGESREGTVLKLRPYDYGQFGSGLDLHMIGGRSNRPIAGFTLRDMTVDGSWLEPGMRRSEQMHCFHAYSPFDGLTFERVDFKRIAGDSAKFLRGKNIRAFECTHTDNGRSAWAFHTGVVGFTSTDERFIRISDQWIDCEPGRDCSDFLVVRAYAPDGFLTTGSVDGFTLEDVETGSVMIGSSALIQLIRPKLSCRQVGMNNVVGAVRQMAGIWAIKELEHLVVENPQIVADAVHTGTLVSLGYRVTTNQETGAKQLKRAQLAEIRGGVILGGNTGIGGVECQELVVGGGIEIRSKNVGVAVSSRADQFDTTVPKVAGPWTVTDAKISAGLYGISAGLGNTMESAILRHGRNIIDAPTPVRLNSPRITEEVIA